MAVVEFTMSTATTPGVTDLAAAWEKVTAYERVASAQVSDELRSLWGAAEGAHTQTVVLAAPGSWRGFLRLVETELEVPDEPPARRVGPFGLEFFSRDVDEVYDRLVAEGTFTAIAPPSDYDMAAIGSGIGRSFGARGPGGVWMLFTTMKSVPPPRALPTVEQLVGPVINMPIATLGRDPAVHLYHEVLGIPIRFDGQLVDPVVNAIIDLPADRAFHCTVFSIGDGQLAEHHIHPAGALAEDAWPSGRLRPGPAVSTFAVDDLDETLARAGAAGLSARGPLAVPDPPYDGRQVACVDGPNGELVELVGS